MTTTTPEDAIKAAASVARDIADGKLSPSALADQAVAELRELFAEVIGPDDPAWPVQVDVARQVLGLGGISADELSEWAAVMCRRAGEAPEPPAPPVDLLPTESAASVDESPPESTDDDGTLGCDTNPAASQGASVGAALAALASAAQQAHAEPAPQRARGEGYDPLAGWNAGGSRRR